MHEKINKRNMIDRTRSKIKEYFLHFFSKSNGYDWTVIAY